MRSTSSRSTSSLERTQRTKRAVAVVFSINGLALGSLLSRTPAVKSGLDLSASSLGLLLVCMSIGAMAALPASGAIVHRLGAARAVLGSAATETAGLLLGSLGMALGSVTVAGLGLLVLGFGNSLWDVAMNVEAAGVERRLNRTVMSRFHAGWSLGSVLGAGLGALCAASGVGVTAQLVTTATLIMPLVAFSVRSFQPVERASAGSGPARSRDLLLRAWRDRRTLSVGLMVLAFAFTEGAANDWLALAFVEGLGSSETVGAVGFGVFVVAMTVSRLVGGAVVDRWGRVGVLRGTATLAASGVTLVILAPAPPWAYAGAFMWGLGAALGFPTGMSAAADDSTQAALHVSVVGSIGYTAFLAGPPLVGFLGDAVGIRQALYVVLAALVLAFGAAAAARPIADPGQSDVGPSPHLAKESA
ncbi:MAG: MFS transporter [Nocardioidaceae bacterium]|nr:MFS transporter [Nocardioidaceae bacterium]